MTEKYVPHDNLSDDVNFNQMQSEGDGGIWVKDIAVGDIVYAQTANTMYVIKRIGEEMHIKGNSDYCPNWTKATIRGSTWGGSMLKIGFIGVGMHLEVWIEEFGILTTTEIKFVKKS